MDQRTREYLAGRFGDYYRAAAIPLPPAADAREWGYIPWRAGGTTMIRHRSRLELGAVGDFLADEAPRHVYFSAATYDDPGSGSMDTKGWRGADLVFDLDADHLPGVDPETTPYAEMLADCKDALERLLDLLEADFGFRDTQVVFSGGRGYHVHVRAESVRGLDSEARREVVDYLRGIDVDGDALVETRVAGDTGATRRTLRTDGGWGRRVHRRLGRLAADLRDADRETALDRLRSYDGIGAGRAERVLDALSEDAVVASGNVERGGTGLRILVDALVEETLSEETAPIDEPVTTDVRRLIRLPGSLHGGSGLVVRRLDRDAVAGFEPLSDAVPDRFRGREVRIRVPESGAGPVSFDGDSFMLDAGTQLADEGLAVFLLCRGRAEKVRE
jgi:DNA primase small subunit